jgi:type IV pilus assembly protein PilV
MKNLHLPQASRGFTLIEVLIAFLVTAIGLLGLASLQVNTLSKQFESYQRAQAVLLAQDMANRIRVDAIAARGVPGVPGYADGDQYGLLGEADCADLDPLTTTTADRNLCEWGTTLAGIGVDLGGQKLGSVIGARGCIENLAGSGDGDVVVRVTIAWQGSSPTVAPSSTCGQDAYGADDRFRRTASIDVVLANLALSP